MNYELVVNLAYAISASGDVSLKCWNLRQIYRTHSKACIFIGYPKGMRGGFFYKPIDNKAFVSTHATLLKKDYIYEELQA